MSGRRKILESDVSFKVTCFPEDFPIEGNVLASGNTLVDAMEESRVRQQLEDGNDWAWCIAYVHGRFAGLSEVENIGGCSYGSQEDFEECDYFEDMKATIVDRMNKTLEGLESRLAVEDVDNV